MRNKGGERKTIPGLTPLIVGLALCLGPYPLFASIPEIDSLKAVADSCFDVGSYQCAHKHYLELLDVEARELGAGHLDAAVTHEKLGTVFETTGEYQKALDHYIEALRIRQKAFGSGHQSLAEAYKKVAALYFELGEYRLALENYAKALSIDEKALGSTHSSVAWDNNLVGCVYLELGDYQSALKSLNQALGIMGDENPNKASVYNNLGMTYKTFDEPEKAQESFAKALEIYENILGILPPSRTDISILLYTFMGHVYFELDEYQAAVANYLKALALQTTALGINHPKVAALHRNMGNVYSCQGNHRESFESYKKALGIWLNSLGPDNPSVGETYSRMGKEALALGNREQALDYLKKSIEIFERSRGKIESEELRASYTETVSQRYESIITLLVEMGKPEEAFQYLERSKSKALKDAWDEKYDVELGHGAIEGKITESKALGTKVDALENQLNTEQQKPDSLRDDARVQNLSRLLAETKAEYFKIATQIQADPDYAFAVRVNPTDIGVLRDDLPSGQKLLMAYSGSDKLYLFLVSLEGYEVKTVEIPSDTLDIVVSLCRTLCGPQYVRELHMKGKLFGWSWDDDGSKFYSEEVSALKDVLSRLYDYLIEPFEEELDRAEVVTFIPSGQLYYIPWGALLDTDNGDLVFVSQRYNWNILTSTELLQCILRREEEAKAKASSVLLVGNPEGAHLPFAEDEVASIKKFYPNSTVLTGDRATEPMLVETTPRNQMLHLATHCFLEAESPWESYILLAKTDTTDGRWTAEEISGQSWQRMQLVTLSACETALGSNRPGLEFESMAKAFSLAMEGPPSIVATLWPVADESTKEFMVTFYEELKDNPKSEALRRAQQKLISSQKYAHPFFWAPFILIGEWR
ncbi:CHAT domain-containing protein [candidate division WOR-3 bacterium]|nr:CHAT domain-containing protein [candidate division WOR-3 bacterium]